MVELNIQKKEISWLKKSMARKSDWFAKNHRPDLIGSVFIGSVKDTYHSTDGYRLHVIKVGDRQMRGQDWTGATGNTFHRFDLKAGKFVDFTENPRPIEQIINLHENNIHDCIMSIECGNLKDVFKDIDVQINECGEHLDLIEINACPDKHIYFIMKNHNERTAGYSHQIQKMVTRTSDHWCRGSVTIRYQYLKDAISIYGSKQRVYIRASSPEFMRSERNGSIKVTSFMPRTQYQQELGCFSIIMPIKE